MGNPYSDEWQKINKIANNVNVLNIKIQQLEVQRSNLYAWLSNMPYETDEEGIDVNAEKRNALYAQIESVNGLIDETNRREQELSSFAYELASNYRQQAAGFREKATKASGASSQFQKLSGYRFGASTASAGADLAQQRTQHYEDYVAILIELAAAAELAAKGTSSAANTQPISERGTFKNPNAIYKGASSANSKTNNADTESVWSGKEGNSVKATKDAMVSSTLSQLGVPGIPYTNGTPNFDAVSHAKVGTAMAGVGMVAAADAMLAKKFGTTGEEIANYRNENGLEWRDDGTGQNANLIPRSISNEYDDGKMSVSEPTPMEALTAYMCAHNYGKDDYEVYSKDSEWQKLHQAAFPEYTPNYVELASNGTISGKFSNIRSKEHSSIVAALNDANVAYCPIELAAEQRTADDIVNQLGGGDLTEGSCSSLAFAYAGNKAGYNVLDFRDGESRSYFADNDSIQIIANLPGIDSKTISGTDDIHCAIELLNGMENGKEYYLATGLHASIVRKADNGFEFLELQSTKNNGWKPLDDTVLRNRFRCASDNTYEYPNFLLDVDSLGKNEEFRDILGYINTAEANQMKGVSGHVR